MKFYNKIRMNVFGCRWERLGKQRCFTDNVQDVPHWIQMKAAGMRPNTIKQIKGRNFIYKVIRYDMVDYGTSPAKFYRRLRYKAWKKI